MIDTGKMVFFYNNLQFLGTEVAGHHWDDAAIYGLRDMDAFREWMLWEKHAVIDVELIKSGGLIGVLPLQFTGGDEPDALQKFTEILQEASRDRARRGVLCDFAGARLGPAHATDGLDEILEAG